MSLRLAGIVGESFVDGPGIRFAVFAQGCPHRCPGCHNPQTHAFEGGEEFEVEELLGMMAENPLLDGLTLSGGEPLEQAPEFSRLARAAKARRLHVMAWTGYTFEFILQHQDEKKGWKELLSCLDLLVDGPFQLERRSLALPLRGSSNQRVLDVPRSLAEGRAVPAHLS